MKKIAIVTASRAEYGILRPLIYRLREEKEFELQVVVTGTHLVEKYGNTQNEILKDGIHIYRKIPILEEGNTSLDISLSMSNALCGFAKYFQEEKPDLLIILGDRTEILGICCAAMNESVPIAHLHGGELTEGAVDDCVRHAITKMSYLHFPATEIYRNRIIQMGEAPERVFNVGALGVENILQIPLLTKEEVYSQLKIPEGQKYVVVTFHPVTLESGEEKQQTEVLLQAMKKKKEYFYLITKANADVGGDIVNKMLENFGTEAENVKLVASLGVVRYLSAVRYSEFVLGNSSSGIIEAPALGVPTVNIGERQKGRLMAESVISCGTETEEIIKAMEIAKGMEHKVSKLYGNGDSSKRITEILKDFLLNDRINLKKKFCDLKQ